MVSANALMLRAGLVKLGEKFYREFDSRLEEIYILPLGGEQEITEADRTFPIVSRIGDLFIHCENPEHLLLLGNSGMGKSSFGLNFCKRVWNGIKDGATDLPIPLYIHLPSYRAHLEKGLLPAVLTEAYLTIEEQKEVVEKSRLLLILDGFDEVSIVGDIYQSQGWDRNGLHISTLVCSRPEVFSYRDISTILGNPTIFYLQSFNEEQTSTYLKAYLEREEHSSELFGKKGKEKEPCTLTVEGYLEWLEKIPSLKALATTPFLLSVIAQTLPSIIQSLLEESSGEIEQRHFTQNELFKFFLAHWFQKQAERVKSQGALPELRTEQIADYMRAYAQNLAGSRMGLDGQLDESPLNEEESLRLEFIEPAHDKALLEQYYGANPKKRHARLFFKEKKDGSKKPIEESIRLIRSGCLLHMVDGRFKFLHKSIAEYLANQELMEGLMGKYDHYLDVLLQGEGQSLNRKLLKDIGMIAGLAEEVKAAADFRALLNNILEQSKKKPGLAYAASNAITILNYAGIDFSRRDLSDVQIPEANLSGGTFVGTNFDGANLSKVYFGNANLRNASWRGALVEGIEFGEALCSLPAKIKAFMDLHLKSETIGILGKDNRLYTLNLNDLHKKATTKNLYFPFLSPSSRTNFNIILGDLSRLLLLTVGMFVLGIILYEIATMWFKPIPLRTSGIQKNYFIDFSDRSENADMRRCRIFLESLGGSTDSYLIKAVSVLFYSAIFLLSTLGKYTKSSLASDLLSYYIRLCLVLEEGKEWSLALLLICAATITYYGLAIYRTISSFTVIPVSYFYKCEGNILVSGHQNGTIRIWLDMKNLTVPLSFGGREAYKFITLTGHVSSIISFACTLGNSLLASGSKDRSIRLWQLPEGKFIRLLEGHQKGVTSLAFSERQWIASGSEDRTVRLWQISDGTTVLVLRGHSGTVTSLVFTIDNKWLASGSEDESIRLWQLPMGEAGRILRGHQGAVTALAIISDKKILISGGQDKTIRFWSAWESSAALEFAEKRKAKLCLNGLNITESLHLSSANQTLCEQRGSIGLPNPGAHLKYQAWCTLFQPISGTASSGPQPSLIGTMRDGTISSRSISEISWVVSVARKKDSAHVFLILEGIKQHKRFIVRAELTENHSHVTISLALLDNLKRFKASVSSYEVNQFEIEAKQGEILLRNIQCDQRKKIYYSRRGDAAIGSRSIFAQNTETHSCVSWARKQIRLIGLDMPSKWHNVVVTLPSDVTQMEEGSSAHTIKMSDLCL